MEIIVIALVLGGIIALIRQLNRNARRTGSQIYDVRSGHGLDRDAERTLHDLNAIEQLARTPLLMHPELMLPPRPRRDDPDWITRA